MQNQLTAPLTYLTSTKPDRSDGVLFPTPCQPHPKTFCSISSKQTLHIWLHQNKTQKNKNKSINNTKELRPQPASQPIPGNAACERITFTLCLQIQKQNSNLSLSFTDDESRALNKTKKTKSNAQSVKGKRDGDENGGMSLDLIPFWACQPRLPGEADLGFHTTPMVQKKPHPPPPRHQNCEQGVSFILFYFFPFLHHASYAINQALFSARGTLSREEMLWVMQQPATDIFFTTLAMPPFFFFFMCESGGGAASDSKPRHVLDI